MCNNSRRMGRWTAIAVVTGLLCCLEANAKKPPKPDEPSEGYTIIPFAPTDFSTDSSAVMDLNDSGQAVGTATCSDGTHYAVHVDLTADPIQYTQWLGFAGAVNNLNQMVGSVRSSEQAAFWKEPGAAPILLPALPYVPPSPVPGGEWVGRELSALDINDDGIVTGLSLDEFEVENADGSVSVLWTETAVVWRVLVDGEGIVDVDGPLSLPPLLLVGHEQSNTIWSCLSELNAADVAYVAGYSSCRVPENSVNFREAVVWEVRVNTVTGKLEVPGFPLGLGTLGLEEQSTSEGLGINNETCVCGSSDGLPVFSTGFLAVEPLPVPRKTLLGSAYDINDAGDVVGRINLPEPGSNTLPGFSYAYLWKQGALIDLTKQISRDSGWDTLKWAGVINNLGVIGGTGSFDVPNRGFLLIPGE